MPYLNNAVNLYNRNLINKAYNFIDAGYIAAFCITEVSFVPGEKETDPDIKQPSEVSDDGEIKFVDIDDAYSLIIYHRLDNVANGVQKQSYGDKDNPEETANLTLTVIAFRNKVKKPIWDLEALAKDVLPDGTVLVSDKGAPLQQFSTYAAGNSTFNALTILQNEYVNVVVPISEISVFQMAYKIISPYEKGCLTSC